MLSLFKEGILVVSVLGSEAMADKISDPSHLVLFPTFLPGGRSPFLTDLITVIVDTPNKSASVLGVNISFGCTVFIF